ncbi:MAG: beta-ketoacyl-ACP synthase, partial [Candidatus Margulisbacteria bacterium]|nr:beta-ketoacyl-ACP synthase [Candidatus Margulisiibacteriota bacterium]
MRRVVLTGLGLISALGNTVPDMLAALRACQNKVKYLPDWEIYQGLKTKLAAPVENFVLPASYGRKEIRSMGRVAQLGVYAAELALQDAGLLGAAVLHNGRLGVAYGSSSGSVDTLLDFYSMLVKHS